MPQLLISNLKMKKTVFIFLLLGTLSIQLFSQENNSETTKKIIVKDTKVLDTAKLSEQFNFLMDNSFKYKDYHSIKNDWLQKYNAHVHDSINKYTTEIEVLKQKNTTLQNENDALKSEVKANEELLNSKDSINFFGASIGKQSYQAIMWTIVWILIFSLAYFIYKFKNSNIITKEAVKRYDELEEEFNEARTRALEREQALNRKLFDEQKKNTK